MTKSKAQGLAGSPTACCGFLSNVQQRWIPALRQAQGDFRGELALRLPRLRFGTLSAQGDLFGECETGLLKYAAFVGLGLGYEALMFQIFFGLVTSTKSFRDISGFTPADHAHQLAVSYGVVYDIN